MSDLYNPTKIDLTENIWIASTVIAYVRMVINDPIRAGDRDRGYQINLENDIQGAIGEILTIAKAETDPECSDISHDILSFDGPVNDVDVVVSKIDQVLRIESKCLMWEQRKRRFLINVRAHERSLERQAIGYLPVITAKGSDVAFTGTIIPSNDVNEWEEFNPRNDPAYSIYLNDITQKYMNSKWNIIRNHIISSRPYVNVIDETVSLVRNNQGRVLEGLREIIDTMNGGTMRTMSERVKGLIRSL